MKNQSHGDHWHTIFLNENQFNEHINLFVQQGRLVFDTNAVDLSGKADSQSIDTSVYSLEDGCVATKAVAVNNVQEGVREIVTLFPTGKPLCFCPPVRLGITIDRWDNRVEANVEGEAKGESLTVCFFLADYLEHKQEISSMKEASFNLVGFAYSCKLCPSGQTIRLEGPEADNWRSRLGEKSVRDSNGDIKPVSLDLSELVFFVQESDEYPEFYKFRSPVSNIEEITSFGVDFYRMKIALLEIGNPVCATLYVRKDLLDRKPEAGESVMGVLWLQGTTAQ